MRDSFIFYRSFFEAIEEADKDSQLIVYRAIARYALDRNEPELTGLAGIIWKLVRPQLDANWKRFENGKKGRMYGAKGGNPNFAKGKSNPYYQHNPKDNPKDNPDITPKITPNNNDNDNDNDNIGITSVIPCAKKSRRFIPPSLMEVQKFIVENGYTVDADTFINFYTAKGWFVGKNKMKDWRAAVRTWQRKEKPKQAGIGVVLTDNSIDKYENDVIKPW